MKIVIAPDSFKGCLPAREVAAAMAAGVRSVLPRAEIVTLPLADGGEGTLEILTAALGGSLRELGVSDPLGRKIRAQYGVAGDRAIIETARACGLGLLSPAERNPLTADTRGVGELIVAAFRDGCRRFLIGLGGSATCDGGAGMLSVPGIRQVLREGEFELLCDVRAPFIGADGAARVFAPQKGASPADVKLLEQRMTGLAWQFARETGTDVSALPGAGAAGGLGGALMAYAGARMSSGVDKIIDLVGFDQAIQGADLILTGEGRSDAQTLLGKVPCGVLRHASGIPVALVSGAITDSGALLQAGFAELIPVSPAGLPLQEAMKPEIAFENIKNAVGRKSGAGIGFSGTEK